MEWYCCRSQDEWADAVRGGAGDGHLRQVQLGGHHEAGHEPVPGAVQHRQTETKQYTRILPQFEGTVYYFNNFISVCKFFSIISIILFQ